MVQFQLFWKWVVTLCVTVDDSRCFNSVKVPETRKHTTSSWRLAMSFCETCTELNLLAHNHRTIVHYVHMVEYTFLFLQSFCAKCWFMSRYNLFARTYAVITHFVGSVPVPKYFLLPGTTGTNIFALCTTTTACNWRVDGLSNTCQTRSEAASRVTILLPSNGCMLCAIFGHHLSHFVGEKTEKVQISSSLVSNAFDAWLWINRK